MEKGKITAILFITIFIEKKKPKGQWPEFKENYYNDKGAEYDSILKVIEQEKLDSFHNYIR
jgi:hypothetical protein